MDAHNRAGIRFAWRGNSLLVLDLEGLAGEHPLTGYFFRQTRFLSTLRLAINDEAPFLCSVAEVSNAVHEIERSGGIALAVTTDVSDYDQVEPELAVQVLLYAAEHYVRDAYVGGKFLAVADKAASNLHAPLAYDGGVRGEFLRNARHRCLYPSAAMHGGAQWLTFTALALLGWSFARRTSGQVDSYSSRALAWPRG